MIQRILILGLLAAQALWLFRPLLPLVEYAVNQEYIAENLCVNQDKPELHCDGKCYLKSRMEEQSGPSTDANGVLVLTPNWDLLFASWIPSASEWFQPEAILSHSQAPDALVPASVHLTIPTPPPDFAG